MNTGRDDNAKQAQPEAMNICRQAGKAVLKDVIHRLRRRANELQTLCDMLPEQPTAEQDEALWNIACSLQRP